MPRLQYQHSGLHCVVYIDAHDAIPGHTGSVGSVPIGADTSCHADTDANVKASGYTGTDTSVPTSAGECRDAGSASIDGSACAVGSAHDSPGASSNAGPAIPGAYASADANGLPPSQRRRHYRRHR